MKLKLLREERHMTQTKIAEELGIKRITYNKYELEQAEPPIKTLIKMANYFNVSLDYLCENNWNNKAYLELWKLSNEQKANLYLIEQLNTTNNLIANGYLLRLFQEQNSHA